MFVTLSFFLDVFLLALVAGDLPAVVFEALVRLCVAGTRGRRDRVQLVERRLGEILLHALRLIVVPCVDGLRLRFHHAERQIAILHAGERHERRSQRDEQGDG